MNHRKGAGRARWTRAKALIFATLVLPACTPTGSAPSATDPPPTTLRSAASSTTASSISNAFPGHTGRLVILDDVGRVLVINPDGTDALPLSSLDDGFTYSQPIWSPDGNLIAAGVAGSDGAGLALIDPTDGESTVVPAASAPFYAYWSPDGKRIAFLNTGPVAGFDMTVHDTTSNETLLFGQGSPYYFSWAPDGESIATHVDVDTMDIRTLDGSVRSLAAPGLFQAPHWTEAGLVHVGASAGGEQVLLTADDTRGLGLVSGRVFFTANRRGTRIALATISEQDGVAVLAQSAPLLPANRLLVLDVVTGEWDIVSADPLGAFFWSPDGDRLLVIGAGETEGTLLWSVWDGELISFESFEPWPGFVFEFLPFFDQYAQSMTLWAPDGSAFAYPAVVNGQPGIWTQEIAGGPSVRIADGTWVSWSSG